jgi:hypothetical protein
MIQSHSPADPPSFTPFACTLLSNDLRQESVWISTVQFGPFLVNWLRTTPTGKAQRAVPSP